MPYDIKVTMVEAADYLEERAKAAGLVDYSVNEHFAQRITSDSRKVLQLRFETLI